MMWPPIVGYYSVEPSWMTNDAVDVLDDDVDVGYCGGIGEVIGTVMGCRWVNGFRRGPVLRNRLGRLVNRGARPRDRRSVREYWWRPRYRRTT